jgi:hypothetical protein
MSRMIISAVITVVSLVVLVMVLVLGTDFTSTLSDNYDNDSAEYNVSAAGIENFTDISENWTPLLIAVSFIVLFIGAMFGVIALVSRVRQ